MLRKSTDEQLMSKITLEHVEELVRNLLHLLTLALIQSFDAKSFDASGGLQIAFKTLNTGQAHFSRTVAPGTENLFKLYPTKDTKRIHLPEIPTGYQAAHRPQEPPSGKPARGQTVKKQLKLTKNKNKKTLKLFKNLPKTAKTVSPEAPHTPPPTKGDGCAKLS